MHLCYRALSFCARFIFQTRPNKLKYKVLYIGQAYGKRGEKSAIDRLSSHETLQKILINSQRDYPEYEIKIMLLEMAYRLGFGIAHPKTPVQVTSTTDDQHIESVVTNLPIEQQVINITEAAIINYFKPFYNSTFIENFPSDKHKSYHQYYEILLLNLIWGSIIFRSLNYFQILHKSNLYGILYTTN